MDTKWKKRKIIISFGVFFLSVSLLLAGAVRSAQQMLSADDWKEYGFSSLFNQDYQKTGRFRRHMQDRLFDFLSIASGEKNSYMNASERKEYMESIGQDKNLRYSITKDGEKLYSNMDDLNWDKNRSKLPNGYNFALYFDGSSVSVIKDGSKLDLYGDGYYRGGSQWYVPGYQNFAVDEASSGVEIIMLAAENPLYYSYAGYGQGGYLYLENRLYDIAQDVREKYESMRAAAAALAAGIALFAVYLFLRKEKKQADEKIGRMTGKIWLEGKLVIVLFVLAGLRAVMASGGYVSLVMGDVSVQEGTYDWPQGTDYSVSEDSLAELGQAYAEESSEVLEQAYNELAQQSENMAVWTNTTAGLPDLLLGFLYCSAEHPVWMLVFFWTVYLLANDAIRNRGHFWDGLIRRLVHLARADSLKQPFAVRAVRRSVFEAVISFTAFAAVLAAAVCYHAAVLNTAEMVLTLCVTVVLYLAQLYGFLVREKRQALELDLFSDAVQAVRIGNYTMEEQPQAGPELRPLFDQLSQIRQGMETAVSEQLKSERMKVELVANVSHDLKTPLTSIISYIEFLKQEEDLPEHVRDYIRILDDKAGRLNHIVQDVFAVSKAASGQLPVVFKQLDFGKLLRQTLADMAEQIQRAPVEVKAEIPQEAVMITADGGRMYRVFQNLIQNALMYSLEGSRVFVALKIEGDYAKASVKNTSRQELCADTDFTERFLRGDKSRTDGGAGLGLSIAKSFTEACGGKFVLEVNADLFVVTIAFLIQ